ncbi:MAG: hypothetical protein WAM14_23870 [Candidatus Nitrosopolaris sp.]
MRAAIFEKPGLENLKVIGNAEKPKISDHDVLIKFKVTGINPINPLPHRSRYQEQSQVA